MAQANVESRGDQGRLARRFVLVGLASTALDLALLTVFKTVGVATLLANTLAFGLAMLFNFGLSRYWTYAGAARRQLGLQLALFVGSSLCGLLLNDALVVLLETPFGTLLGDAPRGYLPAKLVATGASAAWSYLVNRGLVFKA